MVTYPTTVVVPQQHIDAQHSRRKDPSFWIPPIAPSLAINRNGLLCRTTRHLHHDRNHPWLVFEVRILNDHPFSSGSLQACSYRGCLARVAWLEQETLMAGNVSLQDFDRTIRRAIVDKNPLITGAARVLQSLDELNNRSPFIVNRNDNGQSDVLVLSIWEYVAGANRSRQKLPCCR